MLDTISHAVGGAVSSLISECPIVGALLILSVVGNLILAWALSRARKSFTDYLIGRKD